MFNVAIIGGQDFGDYSTFRNKCIYYLKNKAQDGITICSIGDEFVDKFAKKYAIDVKFFNTAWGDYGKDALKVRNNKLISESDALICFGEPKKDYQMIINLANDKKIPIRKVIL